MVGAKPPSKCSQPGRVSVRPRLGVRSEASTTCVHTRCQYIQDGGRPRCGTKKHRLFFQNSIFLQTSHSSAVDPGAVRSTRGTWYCTLLSHLRSKVKYDIFFFSFHVEFFSIGLNS